MSEERRRLSACVCAYSFLLRQIGSARVTDRRNPLKSGLTLFLSSAVVIFLVTAINEFAIVSKINQIIISLLAVLVVNSIMLGILYLAIKPVWKNFK